MIDGPLWLLIMVAIAAIIIINHRDEEAMIELKQTYRIIFVHKGKRLVHDGPMEECWGLIDFCRSTAPVEIISVKDLSE